MAVTLQHFNVAFLAVIFCSCCTFAQVLTPPYFNLAVGRRITATSTCGVGVSEAELFCKLTGANPGDPGLDPHYTVIRGQLCDYCDVSGRSQSHPPEQAVDGTANWWQSPPLSRGLDYNKVNLTIDLAQEFHVAYVFIKMANSPRPGVFALEKSTDYGQTWKAWQYFADTQSDCNTFFGGSDYETSITRDDSVLCTTEYSKVVPLEGGEIVVSLVNGRPNAMDFSNSQSLQEWTKATNVRLRLLRTKTLLGHLMAVANQDPTVTRRYYYSIKDISIGGRCVCNGHADVCDLTNPQNPLQLMCRCQHNTCGPQCETCCPGYVQKPWKAATLMDTNECEQCNCHGHSSECYYDEDVAAAGTSLDIHGQYAGGGVCRNCQHNTAGTNCEKCASGYFRNSFYPITSPYGCERCSCDSSFSTGSCDENGHCECRPEFTGLNCDSCSIGYFGYPYCRECECNVNGTRDQVCEVGGGQCPCKTNYEGPNCDRCAYGYYGFPNCQSCDCANQNPYCDAYDGQCECNINFGGRDCGQCAPGYYGYPTCQDCDCDQSGTTSEVCDAFNGQCLCADGFSGDRCQQCEDGYYQYPRCTECGCDMEGSQLNSCDARGQCICRMNFAGRTCDRCAPGYYRYPECLSCNCDSYGSYEITCDAQSGQCPCRPHYEGLMCDRCRQNYYNYPLCEECNCNPAGAMEVPGYPLGGCGSHTTGQLCECKARVTGHVCDTCLPPYWNLNINNPLGCEDCDCDRRGTVGGSSVCDSDSGMCVCKAFTHARRCGECQSGTYNIQQHNMHGCEDCGCDIGGSLDMSCDQSSGYCTCKPRVTGRQCNEPEHSHYFPTLYQHLYEMEDGFTASTGPIRYGFEDDVFPMYSWKGYAIFSRIQESVHINVEVDRPSLFHVIYRYVSREFATVTADVTATPAQSDGEEQSSTVTFITTYDPMFVTVSGTPFVLNPGTWTFTLTTAENVFVDYMVLLPQDYYEATVLQQPVNTACTVPLTDGLCRLYTYVTPTADNVVVVYGQDGYSDHEQQQSTQMVTDQQILDGLSRCLAGHGMAHIDSQQTNLYIDMQLPHSGRYIFVIEYFSDIGDESQDMSLDVSSDYDRARGTFTMPNCPYIHTCRIAAMDDEGNFKEFNVDGTTASLTLISQMSNFDLGIHRIIAVPVDIWSVEYITPALFCVKENKVCVDSTYPHPTGGVLYEAESTDADQDEENLPPNIIDVTVKVHKMDRREPTATIDADVTNPGRYTFLVHYFQPNHVGFTVYVNVTIADQIYRGTFLASYCPSVSGCRAVVDFSSGTDSPDTTFIDLSDQHYTFTLNTDGDNVLWLDYLVLLPSDQFTSQLLSIQPVDIAGTFINTCGQDNFYISPDSTGFCRDAVFSLVTDYNNGALSCGCNFDGTDTFPCETFGGQCHCKPHVIGRTCDQCKTGYYNFPDCTACNCPSGLCDSQGNCICPPRVTGEDCNVCLPRTFGFDRLIGCEECACDPDGVVNGDLDCNVDTGECSCKASVSGRRCDACEPGHYSFPYCYQCTCDPDGTLPQICDAQNAQCLCKENVLGNNCDMCAANTFYLEAGNPAGCTSCFCFGATASCDSSYLYWSTIHSMRGWGITNLELAHIKRRSGVLSVNVEEDVVIDGEQLLYWIAPSQYLGNKVPSYGGKLRYVIRFNIPDSGPSSGRVGPDVRIEGHDMTLVFMNLEQPNIDVPMTVEVDMRESSFLHEGTKSPVTREQFMTVLAQVSALQIRASYYSNVASISLSEVEFDFAESNGAGDQARTVESCNCPPNYKGPSCEECADGYYRSRAGTYLGVCVPCECNNRADICDAETGECTNCRDNYGGAQCLSCKPGYYENPYSRRCEICSCPLPIESNNFAETCEVLDNGEQFRCICMEGYTGRKCDTCDLGYYGDPNVIGGGSCTPCNCSNNIDISDPRSCSSINGECLMCINNSTGERCEDCEEWFYGDAVEAKNCQECDSNRIGAESCDNLTGESRCKPFVIGETCDRCAPGTFGFDSGNGCTECACGEASYETDSCDLISGQCACKPGVGGRACDVCEEGYWDYAPRGCRQCQCASIGAVTCDAVSGVCQCLPGATGENCDQCLDGWIKVPGEGCQECDTCVTLLLDDLTILDHNITTALEDLDSIAVGAGAIRRLERINMTVAELRPQVDGLIFDPNIDILSPLQEELAEVEALAEETKHLADRTVHEAESLQEQAAETRREAESLEGLITMGEDVATDAVQYVEGVLADILQSIANKNVTELIQQAQDMLDEIQNKDFNTPNDTCHNELRLAYEALEWAQQYLDRGNDQMSIVDNMNSQLDLVREKLYDLQNNTRHSLDNSQATIDMNIRNRALMETIRLSIEQIEEMNTNIGSSLTMSQDMNSQSEVFLEDSRIAYQEVDVVLSQLDQAVRELNAFVDERTTANEELDPLVDEAMRHALSLQARADLLDSLLSDTRSSSEAALNASNAYISIVSAIHDALNASREAVQAAMEALDQSNGLAERARQSRERSEELREDSTTTKRTVNEELEPRLEDSQLTVEEITVVNQNTEDQLTELLLMIDMLPQDGYSQRADAAAELALESETVAREASDTISDIVEQLPDDRARVDQISVDILQVNADILRAQESVHQATELVPQLTERMDNLTVLAETVDRLGYQLIYDAKDLRERITVSRETSARIRVGVSFYSNTTVQLRQPSNLAQSGSYSKVSLFVKTAEPNGLLTYLGGSSGQTTKEFLSLEVVDGFVVYRYDLGSGVATITSTKQINDGQWHEIIAERTGRAGTLTVRTHEENDVINTGESPGTFAVLALDKDTSKFYVGGIPDNANINTAVTSRRLIGFIEDVTFDNVAVGLWDFVQAEHNPDGCFKREVLTTREPTEFRYDGSGYVTLRLGRGNHGLYTQLKMDFKTYATDGLLFLMGDMPNGDTDFFSIELQDGSILFQTNLGSGTGSTTSTARYNDGMWHTLEAIRINQNGILKMDGQTVGSLKTEGTTVELNYEPLIYVGGVKNPHPYDTVTNQGYIGCLRNVQVGTQQYNLNVNEQMKGVTGGCPQMTRIVSFPLGTENAYISYDSVDVDLNYQITLKMKTQQSDGLIYYVTNDQQGDSLAIAIINGRIVVTATSDGEPVQVSPNVDSYNDEYWHYITVTKEGRTLNLVVDDMQTVTETIRDSPRRITTNSPQFFGYISNTYTMSADYMGTEVPFIGCLGDVTVNGEFINFARVSPSDVHGAFLGGCPIADPEPPTILPTFNYPLLPPGPTQPGNNDIQCALPRDPVPNMSPDQQNGFLFGSHPESRMEYDTFPHMDTFEDRSNVSIRFRTEHGSGVIIYMSSDSYDFYTAFMKDDGRIVFKFNCGNGESQIETVERFNDGRWHTLELMRKKRSGTLSVDGVVRSEGQSQGDAQSVNIRGPYYVGGLEASLTELAANHLDQVTSGFVGCLADLSINGVGFGEPDRTHHTQSCSDSTERGSFFYASGGNILLKNEFVVNRDLDIEMYIRPRSDSGVLAFVASPRADFLILQMVNGNIMMTVDNGLGNIQSIYEPPTGSHLCNGQWHHVIAVKAKNVIRLEVDGVMSYPAIGEPGQSSTDTNDPLYIGGIPVALQAHHAVATTEQYVGCIKHLKLSGVLQYLSSGTVEGNVDVGTCPAN